MLQTLARGALVGGTLASLANTSITQYNHVRRGSPGRALGENLIFQAGLIASNYPNPAVRIAWTSCVAGNEIYNGMAPTQAVMQAAMSNVTPIAEFLDRNDTVREAVGGPIMQRLHDSGITHVQSFAQLVRARMENDSDICESTFNDLLIAAGV